jgi:hypothetical protein
VRVAPTAAETTELRALGPRGPAQRRDRHEKAAVSASHREAARHWRGRYRLTIEEMIARRVGSFLCNGIISFLPRQSRERRFK